LGVFYQTIVPIVLFIPSLQNFLFSPVVNLERYVVFRNVGRPDLRLDKNAQGAASPKEAENWEAG
jgi:hypothetical protein